MRVLVLSTRILTNKVIAANDGKPLPLYQKALRVLTAGSIGACIGSPAELALIRMQADATLPEAQRRHYKNAFHALSRIVADEGVLVLWKEAGPTVVRAMTLNMGMLASYDQSVEFFRDNLAPGETCYCRWSKCGIRVFSLQHAVCHLTMPKLKFRRCNPMQVGSIHTLALDCTLKTLKEGGPLKFYTGFPVYCVRIAPHVMLTWIFLSQIQKYQKTIGL